MHVFVGRVALLISFGYVASGMLNNSVLSENHLRKEIFNGYDPMVFPAPKNDSKLEINATVAIRAVDEMNTRKGTATITLIVILQWNNHQLAWSGTKYDDVKEIFSTSKAVWVPDVVLMRSGISMTNEKLHSTKIHSNGRCQVVLLGKIWSSCESKLDSFPSDSHQCQFVFYIYNSNQDKVKLNVVLDSRSLAEPLEIPINGAWKFKGDLRQSVYFKRQGFALQLQLTRNPEYSQRKFVIPLIILASLSFFIHMLPIESGERLSFSITSLLTMMLTVQYFMDHLPESESEPRVLFYARFNLAAMAVSLGLTVVSMKMYHNQPSTFPRWISRFLRRLSAILMIAGNQVSDSESTENKNGVQRNDWVISSRVLDRICMLVSFIMIIITAIAP